MKTKGDILDRVENNFLAKKIAISSFPELFQNLTAADASKCICMLEMVKLYLFCVD